MHAFRVRRAPCSPLRACRRRIRAAATRRKYRGVRVAAHAPSEARQLPGGRRWRRLRQREDGEEQERDAQRRAQRRGRHRLHKQVHARRHHSGAARGTPRAPAPPSMPSMKAALSARSAHVIRSIRFTRGLHTHTQHRHAASHSTRGLSLTSIMCDRNFEGARAAQTRKRSARREARASDLSERYRRSTPICARADILAHTQILPSPPRRAFPRAVPPQNSPLHFALPFLRAAHSSWLK